MGLSEYNPIVNREATIKAQKPLLAFLDTRFPLKWLTLGNDILPQISKTLIGKKNINNYVEARI